MIINRLCYIFFPPSLTLNHKGTSNNHMLSREDVIYINKIYPGGLSPSELYMDFYNEPLIPSKHKLLKILGIILGIILLIILIIWIFKKVKKYKGHSHKFSYGNWKKTHGGSSYRFTPKRY